MHPFSHKSRTPPPRRPYTILALATCHYTSAHARPHALSQPATHSHFSRPHLRPRAGAALSAHAAPLATCSPYEDDLISYVHRFLERVSANAAWARDPEGGVRAPAFAHATPFAVTVSPNARIRAAVALKKPLRVV